MNCFVHYGRLSLHLRDNDTAQSVNGPSVLCTGFEEVRFRSIYRVRISVITILITLSILIPFVSLLSSDVPAQMIMDKNDLKICILKFFGFFLSFDRG